MLCPSCGEENTVGARLCDECTAKLDVVVGNSSATLQELYSTGSSQQGQSSAPIDPPLRTFVGRQREMADLKVSLEDALSGHGRLVMLGGEPGIGKTRTAQELTCLR